MYNLFRNRISIIANLADYAS